MNNSSSLSNSHPQAQAQVTKHAARNNLLHSRKSTSLELKRLQNVNNKSTNRSSQINRLTGSTRGYICGHVSVMGRRRVMEDAVTVAPPGWLGGEYAFFAVYDGHGGPAVAESCSERLHVYLEKHVDKARKLGYGEEKCKFEWDKVLKDCFSEMDGFIGANDESKETMMGSTAVVVILGNEEVVVANCGDSRVVLCRGGVPVPLSCDHKPERPDEIKRIEDAGGLVLNWNGCRVQGVLSTSRSIGDHYLKPYVSPEPEVTVTGLLESDSFLIIATDGLWDFMSNEIACQVVKKCLSGKYTGHSSEGNCASALAELAVAKGSRDDISIIIVQLI